MPPAPDDVVGLREWTVVLDRSDEVEKVRERLGAAGLAVEDREHGFAA
ncbi:MAG: hypothetical protein H0V29_09870 [Thermoleophilaceae bacterium]|nr:hypothetical protein [Thermoleophilaceae bacterium]